MREINTETPDYEDVLLAAGFNVHAFERFGSYQGDWIAVVDTGYIHGYYGSCSGCDAIQAEFGWHGDDTPSKSEQLEKLRKYGKSQYGSEVMTYDELIKELGLEQSEEWERSEKLDMKAWMDKHRPDSLEYWVNEVRKETSKNGKARNRKA